MSTVAPGATLVGICSGYTFKLGTGVGVGTTTGVGVGVGITTGMGVGVGVDISIGVGVGTTTGVVVVEELQPAIATSYCNPYCHCLVFINIRYLPWFVGYF